MTNVLSLFDPDEATARSMVAAANRRAEELAVRLVQVRQYALEKGDHQLEAIVAIRPSADHEED